MALRGAPRPTVVLEEGEIMEENSEEETDEEGDIRARVMKERVLQGIRLFFPQFVEETGELALSLVDKAYEWADHQYGLAEAREWAQGFRVPREFIEEDMMAFKEAGRNLVEMAKRERNAEETVCQRDGWRR